MSPFSDFAGAFLFRLQTRKRQSLRTSRRDVHGTHSHRKMGGRAYPRANFRRPVPLTWLCLVSPLPRRPGGRGSVRAEFVEVGRASVPASQFPQARATDVALPRQCSTMRLTPWSLLRPLSGVGIYWGRSTRGLTTPGSRLAPPSGGAGYPLSPSTHPRTRTSLRAVHGTHSHRKMGGRSSC